MGELDLKKAEEVANEIERLIETDEFKTPIENEVNENQGTKWVCPVCGYIHYGDNPPEKCPLCGVPKELFRKE